MAISFCSLDEAWGNTLCPKNAESNTSNKNYSNYQHILENEEQNRNEIPIKKQSNGKQPSDRNVVNTLPNINNINDRILKLIKNMDKRIKYMEGEKKENNYDYIVLIIVGILIIYIIDKYIN